METAVLYNSRDFYEFIPEDSPLEGFRMTIPDPPMISAPILMNYPWGLHLCYVVTKSCYRWYFGTDHWIPMPSLNHPHANIREVINVNQTWWILGGFIDPQGNGISNCKLLIVNSNTFSICSKNRAFSIAPHRISEFLTESGRWVRGHEYMERYQEGLAKISDMTILAVGGARASANLSSVLRDVDEYNVLTGETSSLGLTSCPITGTTCLNFKAQNGTEMILCLGGICSVPEREFQTKVFVLNLEAKAWMEMPEWEFPKTIRFATLAWVNGYLYVLRGVYEESDFLAVYKFDETSDPVWRLIELPPDHPPNHSRVLTFNRSVIFT